MYEHHLSTIAVLAQKFVGFHWPQLHADALLYNLVCLVPVSPRSPVFTRHAMRPVGLVCSLVMIARCSTAFRPATSVLRRPIRTRALFANSAGRGGATAPSTMMSTEEWPMAKVRKTFVEYFEVSAPLGHRRHRRFGTSASHRFIPTHIATPPSPTPLHPLTPPSHHPHPARTSATTSSTLPPPWCPSTTRRCCSRTRA